MGDGPESESGTGGAPEAPPPSGRTRRPHDHAALDSIPWRERISTQLLGVAAALVLAAVVAFAAVEMAIGRQRLASATASTMLVSETVSASIRHAMLKDDRGDAYAIIDNIGRQAQIAHVRIFNKEGRITFSTVPGSGASSSTSGPRAAAPATARTRASPSPSTPSGPGSTMGGRGGSSPW